MDSFKVVLDGPAPWGFQLQRGKVPLSISRLTPGGKAAQAGVAVGDWVLSIDGENAGGLTHIEAQNKIRACGEHLSLGLSRAQPAQNKLQKALAPAADPPWYTFAPSASLNKTARPFGLARPVGGPGENAKPLVLGPEFKHAIQASIKEFGFNMVASDMISLDRSVNDLRQEEIAGPSVQIKNQDKGLWRKIGESKRHVLPTLERHCCHFQGKSCKVFTASKCEQPTAVSCLS